MHSALDSASCFRGFRVFKNGMPGAISRTPVSGELGLGSIVESVRTWRETPLACLVVLESASIEVPKV